VQTTSRPCYICSETNNPIVASEPVEYRFNRPLLPEGVYKFARCRGCSTLYVDSNVTDEYLEGVYAKETIQSVEEVAGGIEHTQRVGRRLPEFERHWARMKQLRPPRPGEQLLDVGSQTGDFGALAQRDGVQPHGVELSKSYADLCEERWGNGSQVHCGPVTDAPFRSGQFQYITSFETLEHMCDPIDVLCRLRTWLAPEGVLALSVPSSDYFHFKFWLLRRSPVTPLAKWVFERRSEFYKKQVLPHTHIYNFSHKSVRLLLERGGFQPVFLELTGWHGQIRSLAGPLAKVLELMSGSRIGLAPSLFAVAKPSPPQL
jgi:2-polyprenyl-3-methyl-5-hydroxy-6-metoxy-1,4-benzoquinol methylase